MIKELPTAAPPSPSEIKATGSTRQPSVSITVVSFNTRDHLAASLKTLVAQDYPGEVEIVVVDNASEDGSAAMIEEHFPEVALIENLDNRGFAAANNQALAACRGDIICLVNPDALLRPDALSQAIDHLLQNPETGICGGLLVDENGERHPSARRFPTSLGKFLMLSGISARFPKSRILAGQDYDWFDHLSPIQVDWVPGAFTCIRRSLIEDLGFFDERYFLYYEETDLCLRAKRHGWHIDLVPAAVIEHEGGASLLPHDRSGLFREGCSQVPYRKRQRTRSGTPQRHLHRPGLPPHDPHQLTEQRRACTTQTPLRRLRPLGTCEYAAGCRARYSQAPRPVRLPLRLPRDLGSGNRYSESPGHSAELRGAEACNRGTLCLNLSSHRILPPQP